MKYKIFDSGIFFNADCFDVMKSLTHDCIDMVLVDLPYGTTQNKWDSVIPLDKLWKEYYRIGKETTPFVLTAQSPFDKMLGYSNINDLKYEWIWKKENGTGHLNAKKQPLKNHENILVFYRKQCQYNPIMRSGNPYKIKSGRGSSNYNEQKSVVTENKGERYPLSILEFQRDKEKIHPTQKPVALFEYLIRTYTNEKMMVMDNTAGSGTTAIAAINTNPSSICVEKDEEYYEKAIERISKHLEESHDTGNS